MKSSKKFISLEIVGAKVLLVTTVIALILSNSPWHEVYSHFFHDPIIIVFELTTVKTNLLHIINEGLMTIFFLVVGLEIKYELLEGALNSVSKAILPAIAALGGMILPALVYIIFNHHHRINARGWAIPTATDIAFALGIISLLGSKVPTNLKTFLMALAILDDLAAILIIAFFYTDQLSWMFLGLALCCWIILFILNLRGVVRLWPYYIMGLLLWLCLLKSGVHGTLAGVMLAATIPMRAYDRHQRSPLHQLKNWLHPYVALAILPLFAFANAGVYFFNLSLADLHLSILCGVLAGLFIGKQWGVLGFCWLAVKFNIAKLPDNVGWSELYALAVICGIGFTISLFVGGLAFDDYAIAYINSVKLGVIGGSLLSGVVGYGLLVMTHNRKRTSYTCL